MAAAGGIVDQYANLAIVSVTESAANTLTYKKLETGTSLFDKVGMVIHKVEWYLGTSMLQIAAAADQIQAGITNSNTLTDISPTQDGVLIRRQWRRIDFGTAASGQLYSEPFVDEFDRLPGGGIILMPNPLYIGVVGSSLGAAVTLTVRLSFTFISLKDSDFFELMQARQTLIAT